MNTRTLTEAERNTLVNALRVAAERFNEHVSYLQGTHDHVTADARTVNGRLAEQFDNQARDARDLATLLEDSEEIRLTPYVEPISFDSQICLTPERD